jgi:hypothetical protein
MHKFYFCYFFLYYIMKFIYINHYYPIKFVIYDMLYEVIILKFWTVDK